MTFEERMDAITMNLELMGHRLEDTRREAEERHRAWQLDAQASQREAEQRQREAEQRQREAEQRQREWEERYECPSRPLDKEGERDTWEYRATLERSLSDRLSPLPRDEPRRKRLASSIRYPELSLAG